MAPIAGAMAGAWIAEQVGADEAVFRIAQQFGAKAVAKPGRKAAHVGHQIAHDNAFNGILAGLAAGVAVGALIAFTIGTGGLGPLLGAAVLFGSGAAGGFIGAALGGGIGKIASLCGPINSGSPDVFFEKMKAARVMDTAACTRHPGTPPSAIIEGSDTIFINGRPMARIGHRLSCDAVVQEGCETVLGDLTTQGFGPPDASLSVLQQIVLSVAEVAGSRSASRSGGLLNKMLRRLAGEPVDVVTGDYADERVDVEYPGLLPLRLVRTSPGRMQVSGMLGPRWICNWSQRVLVNAAAGTALLEDAGGERLVFAIGAGMSINASHLKAPHYRLTGTLGRMRVFDSRKQHFLLFASAGEADVLELAGIEDRNGNSVMFDRDGDGRLQRIRHGDGSFNDRFDYAPGERTSHHTDATGAVTSFRYDENNLVTWEENPLGAITIRDWDALERLQRNVDPAGRETRFSYDGNGRLVGQTDWAGRSSRWNHDGWGQITASADASGSYRCIYDERGNLVAWEGSDGDNGTATYDGRGARVEETSVGMGTTRWETDHAGRPLVRRDPGSRISRYRWDRFGRLTRRDDPSGRVSEWRFERSATNRRGAASHAIAPDGSEMRFEFDGEGQIAARIRNDGQKTRFVHGAFDALRRIVDPLDAAITFDYDPVGRLETITDPSGGSATMRPAGWLHSATGRDGRPSTNATPLVACVCAGRLTESSSG